MVWNRQLTLDCNLHNMTKDLQHKVFRKVGIPPCYQVLRVGRKQLGGPLPVSLLGVDCSLTVHLLLRLWGGSSYASTQSCLNRSTAAVSPDYTASGFLAQFDNFDLVATSTKAGLSCASAKKILSPLGRVPLAQAASAPPLSSGLALSLLKPAPDATAWIGSAWIVAANPTALSAKAGLSRASADRFRRRQRRPRRAGRATNPSGSWTCWQSPLDLLYCTQPLPACPIRGGYAGVLRMDSNKSKLHLPEALNAVVYLAKQHVMEWLLAAGRAHVNAENISIFLWTGSGNDLFLDSCPQAWFPEERLMLAFLKGLAGGR